MSDFELLNHFTKEEIHELNLNQELIDDIINKKITENNVYEILEYCEYLQYKQDKFDDLIFHIQVMIFEKKLILDPELIKHRIRELIFDDCVLKGECLCNVKIIKYSLKLRHVSCFRYLTEIKNIKIKNKKNYLIDDLCCKKENCLELIKYLISIGYKVTGYVINWASANGHLDMVKYLVSLGNKETKMQ